MQILNNIKKDQLCGDMHIIYDGLISQAKARASYANGWTGFGTSLVALAESEVPQCVEAFKQLDVLFKKFALSQSTLAAEETRNAEDFRDVYERFAVIYRINTEYNNAIIAHHDAVENLRNAKVKKETERDNPKFAQMEAKLDANIAAAHTAAENALEARKTKLREFIQQKERYSAFKIRRFTQGWSRYATALRVATDEQTEILHQMRDQIQRMASGEIIAPSQATSLSSAIANQFSAQPPPAAYPESPFAQNVQPSFPEPANSPPNLTQETTPEPPSQQSFEAEPVQIEAPAFQLDSSQFEPTNTYQPETEQESQNFETPPPEPLEIEGKVDDDGDTNTQFDVYKGPIKDDGFGDFGL